MLAVPLLPAMADASTLAFLLIMARSWQVLCKYLVVHTQSKTYVLHQPQHLHAAIPSVVVLMVVVVVGVL